MFETLILGAGGAGTGPIIWAARHGQLGEWLEAGVAIVDRRGSMGGTIGQYVLNADTLGGTFLECLQGPSCHPALVELRTDPVTLELSAWRTEYPPLELVGRLMERLGAALAASIQGHPRSMFLAGVAARQLRLQADGTVLVDLLDARRGCRTLQAASAVMALGGQQHTLWETIQVRPGLKLDRWQEKIVASDTIMARGGAEEAERVLATSRDAPRAVILGGAHSAFSTAWVLLDRLPDVRFGRAGVQILYRTEPRVFYPTRAAAIAEGYEFTEADVCPATGRVFRLSGLRADGREVWRRMQGMAGTIPEPRVILSSIGAMGSDELTTLLDTADLIVPAFGYRLTTIPIFDPTGRQLTPARRGPSVDAESRLLTEEAGALPNVFGIGLGSGFRPWGAMAGEPSFRGQQNSLWLYQNGLGEQVHAGARAYARLQRGTALQRDRSPVIA
jgi:hypothetical protein